MLISLGVETSDEAHSRKFMFAKKSYFLSIRESLCLGNFFGRQKDKFFFLLFGAVEKPLPSNFIFLVTLLLYSMYLLLS